LFPKESLFRQTNWFLNLYSYPVLVLLPVVFFMTLHQLLTLFVFILAFCDVIALEKQPHDSSYLIEDKIFSLLQQRSDMISRKTLCATRCIVRMCSRHLFFILSTIPYVTRSAAHKTACKLVFFFLHPPSMISTSNFPADNPHR